MRFNRERFFNEIRQWRKVVTKQQADGFTFILDANEKDPLLNRVSWLAYALATAWHETAFTMMPIHEIGSRTYFENRYGGQTRKGRELGNDTKEEGYYYSGAGYVQLTGETNFEKTEVALRKYYPTLIADWEAKNGKRFDMTVGDQPNDFADVKNAMNPTLAYAIMSFGMVNGVFTGKRLAHYLNDNSRDFVNARRIINGTDHAAKIAQYAEKFYDILKACKIPDTVAPITVTPRVQELPKIEELHAEVDNLDIQMEQPIEEQANTFQVPQFNPIDSFVPNVKEVLQPNYSEQTSSKLDGISDVLGKIQEAQAKIEDVTGKVAIVSGGGLTDEAVDIVKKKMSWSSVLQGGIAQVVGYGGIAMAFVTENWYWFVLIGLAIAGIWYINESKKRASEETRKEAEIKANPNLQNVGIS